MSAVQVAEQFAAFFVDWRKLSHFLRNHEGRETRSLQRLMQEVQERVRVAFARAEQLIAMEAQGGGLQLELVIHEIAYVPRMIGARRDVEHNHVWYERFVGP